MDKVFKSYVSVLLPLLAKNFWEESGRKFRSDQGSIGLDLSPDMFIKQRMRMMNCKLHPVFVLSKLNS